MIRKEPVELVLPYTGYSQLSCSATKNREPFFFEVKGRSTARSYKKKENASTYKGCDYINKKVTQSLRN